ncbi:MAG: cytochrome c oxidase subunit II [Spirochaetes bacterium RBG_16_49_21]|nr:MAG: cytochrome c oxidase subunit II [Spirochaetes bacterium RBG_16_49_21]
MENIVKYADNVLIYIIVFCLILLVLITAAMIYFAVRYRKSRTPEASDIRGNLKLELAWMILPTIIALSMFYFGWESFLGLRAVPPDAINIDVNAMQFSWVFIYPNQKESEGLMVVPQGKPVKVNLTSLDVIHSFYLPAFRIKMDAVPNMKTYTWFYADKPGDYHILCAEFCGVGHADMTATLRIVPESEYQKWLNKK